MKPVPLVAAAALALGSCDRGNPVTDRDGLDTLTMESYGKLADGREVTMFTLTNKNRLRARLLNYGAVLISLEVPDREGTFADVTLGFNTLEEWAENPNYFGATVGRFGNRIAGGTFTLDGKVYQLPVNNGPNHLHGGVEGFHKKLWSTRAIEKDGASAVEFTYVSEDGEEGYPGTLTTKVTYTLTDDNELLWEAEATTDAPTIVNLVHHTYWNLSGDPSQTVYDHLLALEADHYLAKNEALIPTGDLAPVEGTPMDFREPTALGKHIDSDFEPIQSGGGYDHCFVFRPSEKEVRFAGSLHSPRTGRFMELFTDQPGVQIYTGNYLGKTRGKNNVLYPMHGGVCLETQHFPDSPNQPRFPSTVLRPGEVYRHTMVHKFSVK